LDAPKVFLFLQLDWTDEELTHALYMYIVYLQIKAKRLQCMYIVSSYIVAD
jgi:hypothetical protein